MNGDWPPDETDDDVPEEVVLDDPEDTDEIVAPDAEPEEGISGA